jgi:hypothetical protein
LKVNWEKEAPSSSNSPWQFSEKVILGSLLKNASRYERD